MGCRECPSIISDLLPVLAILLSLARAVALGNLAKQVPYCGSTEQGDSLVILFSPVC